MHEADEVDDELSPEMEEDVDRDRSRTSCMRLSRRLCAICFSSVCTCTGTVKSGASLMDCLPQHYEAEELLRLCMPAMAMVRSKD
jgi:hypothetical protein